MFLASFHQFQLSGLQFPPLDSNSSGSGEPAKFIQHMDYLYFLPLPLVVLTPLTPDSTARCLALFSLPGLYELSMCSLSSTESCSSFSIQWLLCIHSSLELEGPLAYLLRLYYLSLLLHLYLLINQLPGVDLEIQVKLLPQNPC